MTTPDLTTMPMLVVGGTGKRGRRVAERLASRGIPTRSGSRSAQPPFDWADQATCGPALRRVRAAYVTYYPDLALPGAVGAIRSFVDLALAQGVRRLVLLSGRGEEEAQRAEEVLRTSGADWTILRASRFAQNFSEGYLLDAMRSGEVALPAGDVGEPFVDADDIADAAVAALAEAGVPADFAWLLRYLFATVLDGRNAHLSDGIQQALGRAPRDFTVFAREAAAAGTWGVPAAPIP
jgi:uncharacterized protein YbjT (DUF2867 family)